MSGRGRAAGALVRWGVPLALVLAGVALAATGAQSAGTAVAVAGVCVLVANALLRMGFSSDRDRRREEDARAYFDRHGHWPDERS